MAEIMARQAERPRFLLLPVLMAVGIALFVFNLHRAGWQFGVPSSRIPPNEFEAVQILYGILPRFVVALIAGGLLGLSTALMQQGLRNPLAEPGTIGLLSAARFALAICLIWFPALATNFMSPVLIGSGLALTIVLGLSLRRGFSPLFLIMNGLVLGLLFEACTSILILTHYDDLGDLLLWQAGSLVQDNWNVAIILALSLGAIAAIVMVLQRPISLLDLDDASAASLGLSPMTARLAAVFLSAIAAAIVTSQLGILAFVGLAGTTMASVSGARRFPQRVLYAALMSAAILLLTDQTMQLLEALIAIPSGTVTALFAAPLLLLLLYRTRAPIAVRETFGVNTPTWSASPQQLALLTIIALALAVLVALTLGRTPQGFVVAMGDEWSQLLPWRWPRVMGALTAGGMIAVAGCLMQRMTGNGLASPELLGVSSGAALIMLPVIFLLPPLTRLETMATAGLGSLVFLILALRLAKRSQYAPEKLLLSGLAVTALSGSVLSTVAYFGDIRLTRLVGWLSGSTYAVTPSDAVAALLMLLIALSIMPFLRRWLSLLPLGEVTATSLGVPVGLARLVLVVLTALLTGAATVIIGPISFVGLVVPHLVRLIGIRTPLSHVYGCAIIGALLLVIADWIGRIAAFPWDIPAGLVASVAGALAYALTIRGRG
jgi:iron complex transport system permease protein